MSQTAEVWGELEDWEVLCSFLPEGWEQKAWEYGALRRARGVADADALLRTLLIHIATGCSLAETSVRARQMGLGQMNAAAVYKRLRSAEQWLRWLAEQMRGDLGMVAPTVGRRVRAVDATAVSEPGSTGTDWRIHYAINLQTLQCDFFELTDVHGGEAWRRFPVLPGDIMLGDRGYANPQGVEHIVEAGGDVAVRLNRSALPLGDDRGRKLAVLKPARVLSPKQTGEWAAWVRRESGPSIPGPPCCRAQESAGGRLRAPSAAADGQQEAEARLGRIAGGCSILLSVDQLDGFLEPISGHGVVPFPLADRTGIQAYEIDHGTRSPAQEGSGKLPGLAARQAVCQLVGGTVDRRGKNPFPLGIRTGRTDGADGVKVNTC